MLNKIINYILRTKYYKIVRVYNILSFNFKKRCYEYNEVRQSCYIPFDHECSVIYKKGSWKKGNDLFVYGENHNIESLKIDVEILAESFSNEKVIRFELWECRVGKIQKLYGRTVAPLIYLKDPVNGKICLNIAKNFTDNPYTRTILQHQLITNKVKLTKKLHEYLCH